jgi:hypothetical protein
MCGLLLASLLLHAGAAYGAAGDPEAGSPSEGVYELPLEKGREDAAPGSGGTTAPEGGGGDGGGAPEESGGGGEEEESSSNYRSENNFGSSSQVPGAGDAAIGAGGTNGKAGGRGVAAGDGSAGGGAGPTSSGGGSGADVDQTSAQVPDTGNTSVAGNLALLAVILVLAALAGVFAKRRLRTR